MMVIPYMMKSSNRVTEKPATNLIKKGYVVFIKIILCGYTTFLTM